ncbi:uncharacterized protein LOC135849126 isoform X2 [Planococcus citri]|uniref:uncharacterized protein LOC135849126 isoform X2 n=1 Tax=Planococcus citri TaxID=170843 RepID=UPI0031F7FB9F
MERIHFKELTSKLNALGCETSKLARLFGIVDCILSNLLTCNKTAGIDDQNWPCEVNITSSVSADFKYFNEELKLIIFEEKNRNSSPTGWYIIMLQFVNTPMAYYEVVISEDADMPSVFLKNDEDPSKFFNIRSYLQVVENKFLYPFVRKEISKNKLLKKEFDNERAINPIFCKDFPKDTKKRKLDDDSSTTIEFVLPKCEILNGLVILFDRCPEKPNEPSRLMAVILTILNDVYSIKQLAPEKNAIWPCKISYSNNSILLGYTPRQFIKTEEKKFFVFNICLFSEGNYYYLSISGTNNSYRIIRRINGNLVPIFGICDKREELDKFSNLTSWLESIYLVYFSPVINQSKLPSFPNLISPEDAGSSAGGSSREGTDKSEQDEDESEQDEDGSEQDEDGSEQDEDEN